MLQLSTKNDAQLRQDVRDELRWHTHVDDRAIDVTVSHGAVTLQGTVTHLAGRSAAVHAARRVQGVLAVTDRLEVRHDGADVPTDEELLDRVERTLAWSALVAHLRVCATVENGCVTLEGTVKRWSEREAAAYAVRALAGIRTIDNRIDVRPDTIDDDDLRLAIEAAVERRAFCDPRRIQVLVRDGDVVVCGKVRSAVEQDAAIRIAASASGVRTLRNAIEVDPYA